MRMRTTITLDPDVAAAVSHLQAERRIGVSAAVNDLVRRGLASEHPRRRFVQTTSSMGVPAIALDDIAGVLDALEGDARR
jgi:hypothetical protein